MLKMMIIMKPERNNLFINLNKRVRREHMPSMRRIGDITTPIPMSMAMKTILRILLWFAFVLVFVVIKKSLL